VRLLLDQNLSHRLLDLLADLYPGSHHVRDLGLAAADDEVWSYAAREGLAIVSKDTDLVAFDQDAQGAFLALG
jgi:predicted nuclease of predicted toxin-antitoxin system